MSGEKPVKPVCLYCGSENVSIDGAARWSEEAQAWELSAIYDSGQCDDCGHEHKYFNWKDVEP